jgi:hypothetical protein
MGCARHQSCGGGGGGRGPPVAWAPVSAGAFRCCRVKPYTREGPPGGQGVLALVRTDMCVAGFVGRLAQPGAAGAARTDVPWHGAGPLPGAGPPPAVAHGRRRRRRQQRPGAGERKARAGRRARREAPARVLGAAVRLGRRTRCPEAGAFGGLCWEPRGGAGAGSNSAAKARLQQRAAAPCGGRCGEVSRQPRRPAPSGAWTRSGGTLRVGQRSVLSRSPC